MATASNIIGLRGQLGPLVFRADGSVSQRPPSNPTYHSAPSQARSRENGTEFGRAARAGRLLREALRPVATSIRKPNLTARATARMLQILQLDPLPGRGQRQVRKAHIGALVGFSYNQLALPPALQAAAVTVDPGNLIRVDVPTLRPALDLLPPPGATHYRLQAGIVALDFEAGAAYVAAPTHAPVTHSLGGSTSVALKGAFLLPPDLSRCALIVALAVAFFQHANGQLYALHRKRANRLAIIHAS